MHSSVKNDENGHRGYQAEKQIKGRWLDSVKKNSR